MQFSIGIGRRDRVRFSVAILLSCCTLVAIPFAVQAQDGGGGTIGTGNTSGVMVDAQGVLHRQMEADPTGALAGQRIDEARIRLEGNLARPSQLRKISLTRLERLIKEHGSADDTMLHLAGLTRIQYVFCYPETGDIVIAGPAEPWAVAPSGRVQGVETGRPVIELQDLVVALRAFPPGTGKKAPLIYCSIDPTEEGVARLQQFLMDFGSRAVPDDTQFIVDQLQEKLGMQVITVGGVSPKTHFAQVLVEADYRMKLIGIGLETPPVRLASYVSRVNPATVARNAMQRWFFVPEYECVRVSEDSLAMEIVGEGVKLIGEDEVVTREGRRMSSGKTNRASAQFVAEFTDRYPKLAEHAPVYAQLRNCIDLAVAAAFIQNQDFYDAVGWSLELFGNEKLFPVETYNAPQQVASAVNAMWRGRTLMTPIGGGVQIRATSAIDPSNLLDDKNGEVEKAHAALDLEGLAADQWWWD